MITCSGISGLEPGIIYVRVDVPKSLGNITSCMLLRRRNEAVSQRLLSKLLCGNQYSIHIELAVFTNSFPLRKMMVDGFPLMAFQILTESPDLEVAFVSCFAVEAVSIEQGLGTLKETDLALNP